jgi:hypothetical protein
MSRLAQPQFSFADLELRHQSVHIDPLLGGVLAFLDGQAAPVEQVRQDLVRGLKNPNTGRDWITPSQTLRSLIPMRVKDWDYRELRERINDVIPCAPLRTSRARACPSRMRSTAPSSGSLRQPCKPTIRPWSRPLSNSVWKMASSCFDIPRSILRHCAIPRYLSENSDC